MPAIDLEIFDNDKDFFEDALKITIEGEFVVVTVTIWEQGVGSFELAKLKIHHPVARKIGVEGVTINYELKAAEEE